MIAARSRSCARAALLLVCALAAGAASAQADDAAVLTPGPFTSIEISGTADVTLRQGDRDTVRVTGDTDARRGAEARVFDGRLVLNTPGNWKFWSREKPRVEVQVRDLRRLMISGASDVRGLGMLKFDSLVVTISGAGNVRIDDLKADTLHFDVRGAGGGELGGQVRELQLQVSGKGSFAAEKLKADRAAITISGIGQADVWVVNELRTTVSGIGTVTYWGNPTVQRSNSGMATVEGKGAKP